MKIKMIKFGCLVSTITTLSVLNSAIPALSQRQEVIKGKYIYRLLDAHSACVNILAGRTLGANNIVDAWHSPAANPNDRNTCTYSYVTTWQNNAGWSAGANGVVVNGGVNASHSDNGNTELQYATISIYRFANQACQQQQGTPYWGKARVSGSIYIYCRHNI